LAADRREYGDKGVQKITLVTLVVIAVMLMIAYRSISTTLVMLVTLGIELQVSKGAIAVLANNNLIGLSTFAVNLLVVLAIAASTDYVIFWVGRYQEGRSRGLDREAAYYNMFSGTAHVIVGSGLTVAGAMACLSFCRLPYFQTLGAPCSVGLLVVLAASLTLGPAIVVVKSSTRTRSSAFIGVVSRGGQAISRLRAGHQCQEAAIGPPGTNKVAHGVQ